MSIGAILSRTSNFALRKLNFNYKFWHSYEHQNVDDIDAALQAIASTRNILGAWTNSLDVLVGDRRVDTSTGDVYTAIVAHTTAASGSFSSDRTANPTYWVLDNVANNSVTLAKLVDIATQSFLGRTTAGIGDPEVLTSAQARNVLGLLSNGQCQLNFVDSATIRLDPYDGNRLMIADRPCSIPSAGISLTAAGLSANTNYFIYAVDTNNDGIVDLLEASTTGYTTDTTTGVKIKTGDNSRSLVGYVRVLTGPLFTDSITVRFVRSYYNRRPLDVIAATTSAATTATGTFLIAHISGTASWLQWADEAIEARAISVITAGASPVNAGTAVAIDGAVAGLSGFIGISAGANGPGIATARVGVGNEGHHTAAIFVASAGVNATWGVGSSVIVTKK